MVTTISSRQFNQDTQGAKRAARKGPVFITDRGKPAHVLLTIGAYLQMTGGTRRIAEALALPGAEDAEFEPPRAPIRLNPPDFS